MGRPNWQLRAITADRKERGMCITISCSAPAADGKSRCDYHLALARSRDYARRARLSADGICMDCNLPTAPGYARCDKHLAYRREQQRRYHGAA